MHTELQGRRRTHAYTHTHAHTHTHTHTHTQRERERQRERGGVSVCQCEYVAVIRKGMLVTNARHYARVRVCKCTWMCTHMWGVGSLLDSLSLSLSLFLSLSRAPCHTHTHTRTISLSLSLSLSLPLCVQVLHVCLPFSKGMCIPGQAQLPARLPGKSDQLTGGPPAPGSGQQGPASPHVPQISPLSRPGAIQNPLIRGNIQQQCHQHPNNNVISNKVTKLRMCKSPGPGDGIARLHISRCVFNKHPLLGDYYP
jgi:hypothetical protein